MADDHLCRLGDHYIPRRFLSRLLVSVRCGYHDYATDRRPSTYQSVTAGSSRCDNVAVRHNPIEADIREYFWLLVDKNGPLPDPATGLKSKCRLWLGSVTDQG